MTYPFFRHGMLTGAALSLLTMAACGSDSDETAADVPTVGSVTISHASASPQPMARVQAADSERVLPAGIDSLHIEFEDADGQRVYGPIEVPAAPHVTLSDVPLSAASVTVDYLRNSGYALFTDEVPVTWSSAVGAASPVPEPAVPSTTRWTAGMDDNGVASLTVSVEGGPAQNFLIKGVGYSPAPIGFSSKDGPSFGDIFWDTPGKFLDFERVWKRDMPKIREYGFNAVRTYSLIAHFINNDGTIPDQASINAPGSLLVREHKKFLDEAWNNGDRPVYVLVGIPMPEEIFHKPYYDNPANAAKIEYWDNNFTATVRQMANHPAVLGFTLFNEIGGGPDNYAGNSEYATFFWSQVAKYAERAKTLAPDKLLGWAYFDDPNFAVKTRSYRQTYARHVDFYGVNAFQTERIGAALDPWLKVNQPEAPRPVVLTEYGLPTTVPVSGTRQSGRRDPVHSPDDSVRKVADAVSRVMADAYRHPVTPGMFYFEWSDEWWKQAGGSNVAQEAGEPVTHFPNGGWDEEGFGLHEIALDGRAANQVYTDNDWGKGGNLQVDKLTPKTALLDAVRGVYKNAEKLRKEALNLP